MLGQLLDRPLEVEDNNLNISELYFKISNTIPLSQKDASILAKIKVDYQYKHINKNDCLINTLNQLNPFPLFRNLRKVLFIVPGSTIHERGFKHT